MRDIGSDIDKSCESLGLLHVRSVHRTAHVVRPARRSLCARNYEARTARVVTTCRKDGDGRPQPPANCKRTKTAKNATGRSLFTFANKR